jgi:hypothetical protein
VLARASGKLAVSQGKSAKLVVRLLSAGKDMSGEAEESPLLEPVAKQQLV